MIKENESQEETTEEVQTAVVTEDGLVIGPKVDEEIYIPYINLTDNQFSIRKLKVLSYGSNSDTEKGLIQIYFNANILEGPDEGTNMSMNILSSYFTSYDEARVELSNFLKRQLDNLKEADIKLGEQLSKNKSYAGIFKKAIKTM